MVEYFNRYFMIPQKEGNYSEGREEIIEGISNRKLPTQQRDIMLTLPHFGAITRKMEIPLCLFYTNWIPYTPHQVRLV